MNCIYCGLQMKKTYHNFYKKYNSIYNKECSNINSVYNLYYIDHFKIDNFYNRKSRIFKYQWPEYVQNLKDTFICKCGYTTLTNIPNKNKNIDFRPKQKFGRPKR